MPFDQPMPYGAARRAGVSAWELRKPPWDHPHHGIVRPRADAGDDPGTRVADTIALMGPDSVLTGWAAAYFQGVTMMDGRDHYFQPMPVVLASPEAGQHRHRPGILPTRRSIQPQEMVDFDGVRVATIARAAYDCALDAGSVREAIVAIDMCTSTVIKQSRTTLGNISQLLDNHVKTRGIVRARRAAVLASSRSASPWESRTRDVVVRKVGIAGVLVNAPVFDHNGRLAGIADLLDEATGFVVESDGAGHRRELKHAADNIREEGFEHLGLVVSRVGSVDHKDERALIERLAAGRLQARMNANPRQWTLEKPDWWWHWPPGRRWD